MALCLTNLLQVVEEYGVHWNFFFTLAGLPLLSAVVDTVPGLAMLSPVVVGSAVLSIYQVRCLCLHRQPCT